MISDIDFSYEDESKILITKDLDQNEDIKDINSLVSLNNALISNYLRLTIKESYSLNKIKFILNKRSKAIRGRMNYFRDRRSNAVYIIDYAHTENALELLLRDIKIKSGKLFF